MVGNVLCGEICNVSHWSSAEICFISISAFFIYITRKNALCSNSVFCASLLNGDSKTADSTEEIYKL